MFAKDASTPLSASEASERAAREFVAIEIDQEQVDELRDEIAEVLQEAENDELVSENIDDQISEQPRTQKQLPKFKTESAGQTQKETPRAERSQQSTAADQDSRQEKKSAPNVRHRPAQSAKAPRAQGDNAQAEENQQRRPAAPRQSAPAKKQQPKQAPAAKARSNPNTVEAERNTKHSNETADVQFEQQGKSPSSMSQKAPMDKMSQREQKRMMRREAADNSDQLKASQAASKQKKIAQQNQNQQMGNQKNGQMNQNQMAAPKMVNTPVRPMTKDGYDVWILGDVLLWQAVEENLTYVYSHDVDDTNNTNLHTVDFDWDWGFRLGAGYNIPRDGWDIDLYWTHIRNTADGHQHANTDKTLSQIWTTANNIFSGVGEEASGHWKVNLDQVDLDLGRQFYVGKDLSIRPYAGLRSTWLFQKYNIEFSGTANGRPVEQEASLKNRFWGFGFVAGLDSEWNLGWDISLYGEADMSILLGFFDVDQKGETNDVKTWDQDKSFRAGRAVLDLGMGLKWARSFFKDRYGLTLKAGYEYHLYFDQNQFIQTNGNTEFELFNPLRGNLVFQGVIGSMQIDF